MKRIHTYFKPCFINSEISEKSILYFTEDHLKKLAIHNVNGKYEALSTTTSRIFNELIYILRRVEEMEKNQSGGSVSLNEIIEELKSSVRRFEGYIRSISSKNDLLYQGLFPGGLSEYCRMNQSNTEILMVRIIVYIEKEPKLGANGLGQKINDLVLNYRQTRKEQMAKQQHLVNLKCQRRQLFRKLCLQLQKNLYTLAIEYLDNPEKSRAFFNEDLLNCKRFKHFETIPALSHIN